MLLMNFMVKNTLDQNIGFETNVNFYRRIDGKPCKTIENHLKQQPDLNGSGRK